jgi:hypothetical protein
MIDPPKTIREAVKVRYGGSSFSTETKYNIHRCAYKVWNGGRSGMTSSQCSFKNGHGPAKLYCKTHAKKVK